jgi:N-methylhydantoinase A
VVVPPNAGVGSAVGFLSAPIAYELVRSRHVRLDRFDTILVSKLLAEMAAEARALVETAARGAAIRERRLAYMRYVGQGHEIMVALPNRDLDDTDVAALRHAFEADYAAQFARAIPGAAIEILSWSVLATTPARQAVPLVAAQPRPAPQPAAMRQVFDGRAGASIEVPLFRRTDMSAGVTIAGPAIIAEDETSTFIAASFDAHVDGAGCIVMNRKAAS